MSSLDVCVNGFWTTTSGESARSSLAQEGRWACGSGRRAGGARDSQDLRKVLGLGPPPDCRDRLGVYV